MSLDNLHLHIVDSFDEASACARWLSTVDRKLAVDTEGTGLNVDRDRVRLIQLGRRDTAWVIPLDWPGSWGAFAQEMLRRWDGEIVMHNAPYDTGMIETSLGISLPKHKIHDTRMQAHVLDSTHSLALKNLAVKHVDRRAKMGQQALEEALGAKGGWTWGTIPVSLQQYWAYAGLDAILTDQLDDVLRPLTLADAPLSYELEMAASWTYAKMQRRGVMLDVPYSEELLAEMVRYVNEAEEWCLEHYNVKPGSNDRVAETLAAQGVPLTVLTPGGKYSVAKDILNDVDHPLARVVLGRRQVDRMASFVRGYLGFVDPVDGLIHPNINSVGGTDKNQFEPGGDKGVRTGRSSMDKPNLQNVPIRTSAGKRLRQAFCAPEGYVWVSVDFDQIEMRVLAHESGDERMREAFRHPDVDFFVAMAREIFSEPHFQKSDPRRQFVKNSGYAKAYGSGIEQFSRTAKCTVEQGAAFMRLFDETYPQVQRYVKGIELAARRTLESEGVPYTRSSITNRRHVADEDRLYALNNYRIQGTAGEILKRKAIELDQAGLDKHLMFPVHDEFNLCVPREELDEVLSIVSEVMNDDQLLSVPITASVATGANWGECK